MKAPRWLVQTAEVIFGPVLFFGCLFALWWLS